MFTISTIYQTLHFFHVHPTYILPLLPVLHHILHHFISLLEHSLSSHTSL